MTLKLRKDNKSIIQKLVSLFPLHHLHGIRAQRVGHGNKS